MYLYDRDFAYRMHTQSTLLFKHLIGLYACTPSVPSDEEELHPRLSYTSWGATAPYTRDAPNMYLYDQDFAYRMHTQSTPLFKHLGLHVYAFIYQPLDKPIGTTHFRGQNLNLGAILRLVDVTSMYLYDRDFAYRMHTQSTLLFKHLGLHVYACIYQPLDKPIGTTHFRGRNLNLGAKLRLGDVERMYLYYQDLTSYICMHRLCLY